jgi:hypothetical protein
LELHRLCEPLTPHRESYEHIGDVNMLVHNLRSAWEREQTRKSHIVDPKTAWIAIEIEVPYPPSLIWDLITTPALEGPMLGLEYVKRIDSLGGRTGPNAKFHCAHSSGDFFNKVVDWKPFDYFTTLQQFTSGLEYYRTIRLEYDGTKTKFMLHVSKPQQETPEGFREFLEMAARQGYERLPLAIQSQIDSGNISFAPDETLASRGVNKEPISANAMEIDSNGQVPPSQ